MFDVRTENYTMSGINDEGIKQGDDAIRVLSADGLEVVVDLTVLYKVILSVCIPNSKLIFMTNGKGLPVLIDSK